MTSQNFDPTKPVRARAGMAARIICKNAKGDRPIVALVTEESGGETPRSFKKDGSHGWGVESLLDLVNIPEEYAGWVSLRKNNYNGNIVTSGVYASREMAERDNELLSYCGETFVTTVKIEWRE